MQSFCRMTVLEQLRRVLAVVLMACFFLPLAECQKKEDAPPESVPQEASQPCCAGVAEKDKGFWDTPEKARFCPAESPMLDPAFWGWFGLLGGPLGCAILRGIVRRPSGVTLLAGVEISLALLLLWWFGGLLKWGWHLSWGGWLAAPVAALLGFAAACDLVRMLCRWSARWNWKDFLRLTD